MRRYRVTAAGLTLLIMLGVAASAWGAEPRWPRFHGPRLDNISTETGLLKQWPPGGPELLWTAKGIGYGFSTVAIAHGLIYTTGNVGADTLITALDLKGRIQWRARNGPAYKREYPGTRSTPTIDNARLYHENADGDVVCLDAKTGRRIWSLNILEKFGGRNIQWALAESPLIDGDNVICSPGGQNAGIVALDKKTGRTVWVCGETRDKPGYASPAMFEQAGVRQIVTMTAKAVVGVDAKTGKLLWRHRRITPFDENILTPVCHDGHIFISTQRTNSELLKLTGQGSEFSVESVWENRALDNQHGGVVLLNGYLYGAAHPGRGGRWICLEFKTGKTMYSERGVGRGSLSCADGMLYTFSERGGTVGLVKATPDEHKVVSQFNIPRGGRGPCWAHPVICGGRLYLRHGDFLYAYDIKAK